MKLVPGAGSMITKDSFGDVQLHVEWTTPPIADPTVVGQSRGNSGVILMGRYEVQVLSGYNNPTYADGGNGAILRRVSTDGESLPSRRAMAFTP